MAGCSLQRDREGEHTSPCQRAGCRRRHAHSMGAMQGTTDHAAWPTGGVSMVLRDGNTGQGEGKGAHECPRFGGIGKTLTPPKGTLNASRGKQEASVPSVTGNCSVARCE